MSTLDRHTITLTHRHASVRRRMLGLGSVMLGASLLARVIVHGWLGPPGVAPESPPSCTDVDHITPACDALLPEPLQGLPPIDAAAAHATRLKFAYLVQEPDGQLRPTELLLAGMPTMPDIAFDDYDLLSKTTNQHIDPENTSYAPPGPLSDTPPDGVDPATWVQWRTMTRQARESNVVEPYYTSQVSRQQQARDHLLPSVWDRANVDWAYRHDAWKLRAARHDVGVTIANAFPFGAIGGGLLALLGGIGLLRSRRKLVITPHRLELGEHTVLLHDVADAALQDDALDLVTNEGSWTTAPFLIDPADQPMLREHLRSAMRNAANSEEKSRALDAMRALRGQSS